MIPEAKFFLISGKKKNTGIMETMIAARDIVIGLRFCCISDAPSFPVA